jgi:hypothetical protein
MLSLPTSLPQPVSPPCAGRDATPPRVRWGLFFSSLPDVSLSLLCHCLPDPPHALATSPLHRTCLPALPSLSLVLPLPRIDIPLRCGISSQRVRLLRVC